MINKTCKSREKYETLSTGVPNSPFEEILKYAQQKNNETEYMKRVGSLIILDYTRDIICRDGLRRASVFSRLSLCIPVSGGREIIRQDKQFSFEGAPNEKLLRPYNSMCISLLKRTLETTHRERIHHQGHFHGHCRWHRNKAR